MLLTVQKAKRMLGQNYEAVWLVMVGLAVAWCLGLVVANACDWWGPEDAPIGHTADGHLILVNGKQGFLTDSQGNMLTEDESSSIDYWKIFALATLPALGGAAYLYAKKQHDQMSDSLVSGSLQQFTISKSYQSTSPLANTWKDGLNLSEACVISLKEIMVSMDGPFIDSVKSAYETALRTHKNNVSSFKYLSPILKVSSSGNPALLKATEQLAMDVRSMEDLVASCSSLYSASFISQPHTDIIANEILSIEDRLTALREVSSHELAPVEDRLDT